MKSASRIALCISLLLSTLAAQKRPAEPRSSPESSNKLISFKVTGTSRYTDKEVLAASGLQLGRQVADGDFKEAVQRLGELGLFSDAAYSYSTSDAGTKLEMQLSDVEASKLVPARFENFAWFTDDELHAAIAKSVPLFKDVLPVSGTLPDRVSEALQALLSEKQIPGHVNFMREAAQNESALIAIVYRIEEVSIRIQNVEFPGASPDQAELLAAAANPLIGAEYGRTTLQTAAKFDLLPVYFQRGYLKATFGQVTARVLPQPTASGDSSPAEEQGPPEIRVGAILPVNPGDIYLSSGVEVRGASAIKVDEITARLHLNPGEPANAVRLLRDAEHVTLLYRSRGYMTANLTTEPQFDDEKHTVRYSLNVSEGELYKMGELEILGLDPQATARMQAAWTLHEGQPYNADYPKKFLADTQKLVPAGGGWDASIHESPDARDRTVDVEIRFKQR
jgi:outer membrane protein assembly factor BamA